MREGPRNVFQEQILLGVCWAVHSFLVRLLENLEDVRVYLQRIADQGSPDLASVTHWNAAPGDLLQHFLVVSEVSFLDLGKEHSKPEIELLLRVLVPEVLDVLLCMLHVFLGVILILTEGLLLLLLGLGDLELRVPLEALERLEQRGDLPRIGVVL